MTVHILRIAAIAGRNYFSFDQMPIVLSRISNRLVFFAEPEVYYVEHPFLFILVEKFSRF